MISIFLFAACQLGLTQGNPDYIYSQDSDSIPTSQKEVPLEEESSAPPTKQPSVENHDIGHIDENMEIPQEFIVADSPLLYEDIIYENGISTPMLSFETTQPTSEDSDTKNEEGTSSEDETCFIELELLCGPDGWVDRQLRAQTTEEQHFFWNSSCENEDQSWDYYLSEFFTLTLNQGEELTLSLCDDEQNCDNLTEKDLGIRVLSNDSELEDIQKASSWTFEYTCQ